MRHQAFCEQVNQLVMIYGTGHESYLEQMWFVIWCLPSWLRYGLTAQLDPAHPLVFLVWPKQPVICGKSETL
jgi:hypothetical protein